MNETGTMRELILGVDLEPRYRADTDLNGTWHVWRRVSARGWATLRRCEGRGAAEALAESLNSRHSSGALADSDASGRPALKHAGVSN